VLTCLSYGYRSLKTTLYFSTRVDKEGLNQEVLQRELAEPVEYSPPVADYRQVSLMDEQQNPSIVPTMSDDDLALGIGP
jgi:hypothetical protein